MVEAVSAPYKRDLWQVAVPENPCFNPGKLFTFRGTFHTHPIRQRMCRTLAASDSGVCEELRKAFHSHTADDQERYIREILDAAFSLCPRGLSPSSYRLYESMQLGRCPVVISDHWIPPQGPDWEDFSIRIPEAGLEHLQPTLDERFQAAERMGRAAKENWDRFYAWPARYRTFLEMVLALQNSRKTHPEVAELQDIWHSRELMKLYDWTLPGRVRQRLTNMARRLLQQPPPT